jgi:hypothetical protein
MLLGISGGDKPKGHPRGNNRTAGATESSPQIKERTATAKRSNLDKRQPVGCSRCIALAVKPKAQIEQSKQ